MAKKLKHEDIIRVVDNQIHVKQGVRLLTYSDYLNQESKPRGLVKKEEVTALKNK